MIIVDADASTFLSTGNYILTTDVCNSSITSESLWSNNEYEKAIALHAVRRLLLDRGSSTVGNDIDMIDGMIYILCLIYYAYLY